ncbi:MAG: alpha/beta hydrolase [Actinomycetaceae bacterium]|nr:alpha/beta hydrolase [Actinomycetaceae bacterium]MDY6083483.1 alpha/beta hydrolase [Actinomycetaceae bacterium]
MEWKPDLLGSGFESTTLPLGHDDEGPVVATLVKHIPDDDPGMRTVRAHHAEHSEPRHWWNRLFASRTHASGQQPSFAFLAVHGWNDYFYQTELARHVSLAGGAFYALDLRKYGRSLRTWQTFGFTSTLHVYSEDLNAAVHAIRQDLAEHAEHDASHLHIPLIVYGHSTGGLIVPLWIKDHHPEVAGLVLNSPWIELQMSTNTRLAAAPLVDALAKRSPKSVIPQSDTGFYQRVLTGYIGEEEDLASLRKPLDPRDPAEPEDDPFFAGGWHPDPRLRHAPSWPVRAAWLSAVLAGHAEVAQGLNLTMPILLLTSAESVSGNEWSDAFRRADGVLSVKQIWKRVPYLGSDVHLVKLSGAIHDVTLSRFSVREKAFNRIARFCASIVA